MGKVHHEDVHAQRIETFSLRVSTQTCTKIKTKSYRSKNPEAQTTKEVNI